MLRSDLPKRKAQYALKVAGLRLPLPDRFMSGLVAPLTDWVGGCYLDRRIAAGIRSLKQQHPGWRFGETHCHSVFSDGHHTVPDILDRAAALGLDFTVLTEHLTAKKHPMEYAIRSIEKRREHITAWPHPKTPPVAVYPAFEISTQQGHLILLFPEDYLDGHDLKTLERRFLPFDRAVLPLETAARWGRALGGVSIVPHPNIERSYPFGVSTAFVQQYLTGLVDAVEDISTGHGYRADHSRQLGLAAIGSSDDHFNVLIGSAVTGYDAARYPDLLTAIRARGTRAVQVDDSLRALIAAARAVL